MKKSDELSRRRDSMHESSGVEENMVRPGTKKGSAVCLGE